MLSIQQDDVLNSKSKILESIPGISKASATLLLSFLPELGTLNKRKISALTGVCPFDNQSGSYNGKKYIRGGRAAPRKKLYMCALTTIKYNLVFIGIVIINSFFVLFDLFIKLKFFTLIYYA